MARARRSRSAYVCRFLSSVAFSTNTKQGRSGPRRARSLTTSTSEENPIPSRRARIFVSAPGGLGRENDLVRGRGAQVQISSATSPDTPRLQRFYENGEG